MTRAPHAPRFAFGSLAEVAEAVRASGGRLTRPRQAVLEALFAADAPLTAEQVAGAGPARLDLVSVYRALEHLERLGVGQHVHLGHGPGLYMLTGSGEREYLVCERCDRVTTVVPAQLDPVRDQIRAAFGYEARFSHFPITGLCPRCAAADHAR